MKLLEWRPYKKGQFGYRDRGPQGECPVKTGLMLPQATELPEAGGRPTVPQRLQREQGPANTLIWDFWPPGQWDDKFLLFKGTVCATLL